jgi:hypothetical protein
MEMENINEKIFPINFKTITMGRWANSSKIDKKFYDFLFKFFEDGKYDEYRIIVSERFKN